jgi:putative hydrolase of HD superfamily
VSGGPEAGAALAALVHAGFGLKHTARAGWVRAGIDAPESVAAHSWGMSLLALAACPPELDLARVLALCAVHDLPECEVGDITPHDGVSPEEKRSRERQAAARLFAAHPRLWGLWEEYEQQRSPEARFVKALDKADMGAQAQVYAQQRGADTRPFVESALRGLPEGPLRDLARGGRGA